MATAIPGPIRRKRPFAPDLYEKILAAGAALLLAALVRGRPHWGQVPPIVWAHLLTIVAALALTPTMLLRPRGDRLHRTLGTIWVAAMLATAIASFWVRLSHPGRFSLIHLLSLWTLIQVPVIYWSARTHQVRRHRRAVRAMVTGALLIAGFFTFPFQRMLGQWLFG